MNGEVQKLRQLALACRKQAKIASNADTASALAHMADRYDHEADELAYGRTCACSEGSTHILRHGE